MSMAVVDCSASMVLFNNNPQMVQEAVESFHRACGLEKHLYVVDNSPSPFLENVLQRFPVTYNYTEKNLGYGKGHNWALNQAGESKYHLVLNPDVTFSPGVLKKLAEYMDAHPEVAIISPKVLYKTGEIQFLNRRLPTVYDLLLRRFLPRPLRSFFRNRLDRYEMKDVGYEHIYQPCFISGAFMLCRKDVLEEVGGFDPRYFLYFEDVDLSRKVQERGYKTIYYPYVSVTHVWDRAPYNSLKMTLIMILNGIRYFNKWGWKLY